MAKSFFRPEALAAADRLDGLQQSMRVTSSYTRAAIGLVAVAVGCAVLACAWVEAPIRVAAHGYFVDESGVLIAPVRAAANGYVDEVLVGVGDVVEQDQVIARLRMPESDNQIAEALAELKALKQSLAEKATLRRNDSDNRARERAARERTLRSSIESSKRALMNHAHRLTDLKGLLERGYTKRQVVTDARTRFDQTRESILTAQASLESLNSDAKALEVRHLREAASDRLIWQRERDKLIALQASHVQSITVKAPSSGHISAIDMQRGGLVTRGTMLAEILPGSQKAPTLQAVAFVPLSQGKRIDAGDRVLITPASLSEGAHDRVVAEVRHVSETASSPTALETLLGSKVLAQQAGKDGPVFSVSLDVAHDREGRYRWTSNAPDIPAISAGTPFSADITIERIPILTLAVPAFKKLIGFSRDSWTDMPS